MTKKEKAKAASHAWYKANRAKVTKKTKAWAKANPDKLRRYKRQFYLENRDRIVEKLYGLSPGGYQRLLFSQGAACGICKVVFSDTPCVDHDHLTGSTRGLLCRKCNKALGLFGDSIASLCSAVTYITKRNL